MQIETGNSQPIDYFSKERGKFESNLQAARKTFEPEAIHQYRLSLKRMRALFNMLEFVADKGNTASLLYVPLKVCFKSGGRLRDIHVHLEMLEGYEENLGTYFEKIREFLFFREVREQKKFRKKTKKSYNKALDRAESFIDATQQNIPDEEFSRNCVTWVKTELEYLEEIFPFIYDPEIFHLYRRHQKATFYMIDFINVFTRVSVGLECPIDRVKELARKIGTWHDYYNLFLRVRHISDLYNDSRLLVSKECDLLIPLLIERQEQMLRMLKDELQDKELYRLAHTGQ